MLAFSDLLKKVKFKKKTDRKLNCVSVLFCTRTTQTNFGYTQDAECFSGKLSSVEAVALCVVCCVLNQTQSLPPLVQRMAQKHVIFLGNKDSFKDESIA